MTNRQTSKSTAFCKLLLFMLLISLITPVWGQNTNRFNYPDQPDGAYFKSYLAATKAMAIAPLHWSTKQWIVSGSVLTAGVLIYVADDQIGDFFRRNQTSGSSNVSKYGLEPWGSGVYPAILLGSYYLYGIAAHDPTARQIALGGTQAWVMSALTVQLLKFVTHRHRPYQDMPANPGLWEGPFQGFEYTSFASGHTITAFSLAAFFSSVYRDRPWVGVISYGIATGVGLSRIYDNQHWASDVVIGAALGVAIGRMVFKLMQPESKLSMGVGGNGSILLVYQF